MSPSCRSKECPAVTAPPAITAPLYQLTFATLRLLGRVPYGPTVVPLLLALSLRSCLE